MLSALSRVPYRVDARLFLRIRRRQPQSREKSRQDRVDGSQTGADDGRVDLGHGPASDNDGGPVRHRYAVDELQRPDQREYAHPRMSVMMSTGVGACLQECQQKHKGQSQLLPPRNAQLAENRQGQRKDDEIGRDVDARMAPVYAKRLAVCALPLGKVPEGVERDADGEQRRDDPEVGGDHYAKHDLGREVDIVVSKRPQIETQDRDFDRGQSEGIGDVYAERYLAHVSLRLPMSGGVWRLEAHLEVARDGVGFQGTE